MSVRQRRILEKVLPLVILVGLLAVSFISVMILLLVNETDLLPVDVPLYLVINGAHFIGSWGLFFYIVVLIYQVSLARGVKKIADRKRILNRSIFVFIVIAFLLMILKYGGNYYFQDRLTKLEKNYDYASIFYGEGSAAFLEARNVFDYATQEDLDGYKFSRIQELQNLVDRAENAFSLYLEYDNKMHIDKNRLNIVVQSKSEISAWNFKLSNSRNHTNEIIPFSLGEKYLMVEKAAALLNEAQVRDEVLPAIEAYEIYEKGTIHNPNDDEFREGRAKSKAIVDSFVFYRSNIKLLFENPYFTGFNFKNTPFTDAQGNLVNEKISAEKVVLYNGEYYFQGVVVEGRNADESKLLYKIESDYAKREGSRLTFKCLNLAIKRSDYRQGVVQEATDSIYSEGVPFKCPNFAIQAFSEQKIKTLDQGMIISSLLLSYYSPSDPEYIMLWGHLILLFVEIILMVTIPVWVVLVSLEAKSRKSFYYYSKRVVAFPISVLGVFIVYTSIRAYVAKIIELLVEYLSIIETFVVLVIFWGLFTLVIFLIYIHRKRINKI